MNQTYFMIDQTNPGKHRPNKLRVGSYNDCVETPAMSKETPKPLQLKKERIDDPSDIAALREIGTSESVNADMIPVFMSGKNLVRPNQSI